MTDSNSQFFDRSGYLGASLSFMAADTRKGVAGSAKAAFDVVKSHASAGSSAAAYVDKIQKLVR